jgi:hypothetical protein
MEHYGFDRVSNIDKNHSILHTKYKSGPLSWFEIADKRNGNPSPIKIIFDYCIKNKIYDFDKINDLLNDFGYLPIFDS